VHVLNELSQGYNPMFSSELGNEPKKLLFVVFPEEFILVASSFLSPKVNALVTSLGPSFILL